MKHHYTKQRGWGAYTPRSLAKWLNSGVARQGGAVRPEPYYSFKERLLQAWDVFTYKADALYWKERDED